MFYLDGVIFLGTLEDFFSLLDLDAVVIIFDNGKWRATGRSGSKRWYEVDAAVGISILEAVQRDRLTDFLQQQRFILFLWRQHDVFPRRGLNSVLHAGKVERSFDCGWLARGERWLLSCPYRHG